MKKICIFLIICFLAIGAVIYEVGNNNIMQTFSMQGSRGQEVTNIQTKLKQLGFYTFTVDGIYGWRTKAAVVSFQKSKGLVADGVAGSATLKALGLTSSNNFSQNDINLLARVISAEAKGEPYKGQVAVGAVVLNRIKHPSFPKTLAGVIYQPGAFESVTNNQIWQPIASSAITAAHDAINGWDPTYGCIYFYNPAKTTNAWMLARKVIITIGKHRFTM